MEKEKRGNKKKGGKKVLAAAACIGLLAAAGSFFFWQKSNADAAEGAVVIEAGENGEIIYAQIDNIVGNDIDVSIMEETASGSGTPDRKFPDKMPSNPAMPDRKFPAGKMGPGICRMECPRECRAAIRRMEPALWATVGTKVETAPETALRAAQETTPEAYPPLLIQVKQEALKFRQAHR